MAGSTPKFSSLKKITEAKKDLEKRTEAAIKEAIQELFNKHPILKSFGWKQYAPYFNDGEPCYFSLSHYHFSLNKTDKQALEALKKYIEKENLESFSKNKDLYFEEYNDVFSGYTKQQPPFLKDIKILYSLLQDHEDVLEKVFGTDMNITCTRKGFTLTEFNDHD